MSKKNYIVGIDVGTAEVRVGLGEPRPDGSVSIIGLGLSPSDGVRKGVIVDLEKTVESILNAVEEAERMAGFKIDSAYVGLKGLNIDLITNRGVVAVTSDDREIREEDLERVIQAARVVALPMDREIVDIIPREYIVDGFDGIRDPVGMLGVRLEVDAMVVTSLITSLHNLLRCINKAGINIRGLVLQALANAEVSLTSDERDLGVFLIDIGSGTTEIALFHHGKLQKLAVIPVGGDHITTDLAAGLRINHQNAEVLKRENASALQSLADSEPKIEIKSVGSNELRLVSERELTSFIEPRIQEIFQIAKEEMIKMGWSHLPPAGVVLRGGVSSMRGIVEVAGDFFESDQIRLADFEVSGIQSPTYSTVIGLLYYIQRYQPRMFVNERSKTVKKRGPGIWQRIKDWMTDIID
ncbi:MAG: cell division protein FtsA [Bacillota bacterium]|nr:cell division protein FtsA [Bacillota bacterium]MDW7728559.1 cell division protein FtsA [Bacillota bacterium]